jgi:hypothetical protein
MPIIDQETRKALRQLNPLSFANKEMPRDLADAEPTLAAIHKALVAVETYRSRNPGEALDREMTQPLYALLGKVGEAIDTHRKARVQPAAFDELRKAVALLTGRFKEAAYEAWQGRQGYKPAAEPGALGAERLGALAGLLKVPLEKQALRGALDRCKRGYEADRSPYTLVAAEADAAAGKHREPIPVVVGKVETFDTNPKGAATFFKLEDKAARRKTLQVKHGQTLHLVAYEGEGGPPPDPGDKAITGASAEAVIELASRTILLARALCPNGTFNNAKSRAWQNDHWEYTYQAPAAQVRWLISQSETMRDTLQEPFKPFGKPPEAVEKTFLRSMAAMGRATYLSGGGVCAQMSHLTLGLLTLLAPQGTQIAVVYDKVIDHSYTVLRRDDTDWFTCDPWPTRPHVIPWRFSCFPWRNILNHFLIEVHKPVSVAYGIAFQAGHIAQAKFKAGKEVNSQRAPDHQWLHESNLINGEDYRLIFQLAAQGQSEAAIVTALADGGYPAPRHNQPWSAADVRAVLGSKVHRDCAAWVGARPPLCTESDYGKALTDKWR